MSPSESRITNIALQRATMNLLKRNKRINQLESLVASLQAENNALRAAVRYQDDLLTESVEGPGQALAAAAVYEAERARVAAQQTNVEGGTRTPGLDLQVESDRSGPPSASSETPATCPTCGSHLTDVFMFQFGGICTAERHDDWHHEPRAIPVQPPLRCPDCAGDLDTLGAICTDCGAKQMEFYAADTEEGRHNHSAWYPCPNSHGWHPNFPTLHRIPVQPASEPKKCAVCAGAGELFWDYDDPIVEASVEASAPCPPCHGTGIAPTQEEGHA